MTTIIYNYQSLHQVLVNLENLLLESSETRSVGSIFYIGISCDMRRVDKIGRITKMKIGCKINAVVFLAITSIRICHKQRRLSLSPKLNNCSSFGGKLME